MNTILHEELDIDFDHTQLQQDWSNIKNKLLAYHWYGYENRHSSQVAVQSGPLDTNQYTSSCGKQQLQGTGYKSRDWNVVNDLFLGSAFEKLCNEYECYKMRVMRLWPKSMYSVHIDKSPRFHIALDTNPGAFMLWPDAPTGADLHKGLGTVLHIPEKTIYYTNTCPRHTACNSGDTYRDHIVFCSDKLLKSYEGTYNRLPKDTPRGVL